MKTGSRFPLRITAYLVVSFALAVCSPTRLTQTLARTLTSDPITDATVLATTPATAPAAMQPTGSASCDPNFTKIYAIQGSGAASSMAGMTQTTQGIVVGDFQGQSKLNGFFIQDATGDNNPATSDGLFIYEPQGTKPLQIGQRVQVTGAISEFKDLTELTVTSIVDCGATSNVAPVAVNLPFHDIQEAERYEGMLVSFPQTLTVSDVFGLGRYGEIVLSQGRLFTPTNVYPPSVQVDALSAANKLNQIVLDDGGSAQNPDPILFPGPNGLSAQNSLRTGDTVQGLTGVLTQAFGSYRVEVNRAPNFDLTANPRPTTATLNGTLRVAGANVENFFNGDGAGGGFPTSRGARTPEEYQRQRTKLIAALKLVNADVLTLMEVENDGDGPQSAAQNILNGLNQATAPGTYALVPDPTSGVGTDQIRVKLFYKPSSVELIGASLSDPSDLFERKPIAQTFRQKSNGEVFTLIGNHFKSKGSCPNDNGSPDADKKDGQSCWNARRTQQATELLSFIQTVITKAGDPDVLVMGDLNAYAKEDPIRTLETAGLVNEIASHIANPYSYSFSSEAGYLDHALATASLNPQVADVLELHINADEPPVLGYTEQFKSPGQITSLYTPDQYRISDHDPVLVGLKLGGAGPATAVATASR